MGVVFKPIIVKQKYAKPISTVWDAITVADQMRQWFFKELKNFKPEVGFQTQFDVQSTERIFPHQWKILEVEPLKKITYDWRYDGYPGESVVEFLLTKDGDQTLLSLTHTVIKNFPQDIPEFLRESGVAGWKYFIQESLRSFLE